MGLISYRWFGYSQSPQPSVRPIPAAPIAQLPFEIEIAILIAGNASAKLSESHTQDLPGLKPDCFLPDPPVTPRKIANGLISNSPTKKLGKGNTSGTGAITGILPVPLSQAGCLCHKKKMTLFNRNENCDNCWSNCDRHTIYTPGM